MMRRTWTQRARRLARMPLVLAVAANLGAPAAALAREELAQDEDVPSVSRPVVQQIPANDTMALNAALTRVAQNPRDAGALVDAGNAALALGDTDAAIGFYRRAGQIAPSDGRVKAGLAGAFVRNGDPFSAIPLFEEAERAGATGADMLMDRGLAYDLVGNNPRAQTYYRQAIARGAGDEALRRLALSQAIGGDRRAAEVTLAPLLGNADKAAARTRIFALAAAGAADEAIALSRTTMPPELAAGMAPYLRYMRMLTPAQQAAAATLGQFPRASEIGRDDPRVAAFAPPRAVAVAQATPVSTGIRPGRTRRSDGSRPSAAIAASAAPTAPVPSVSSPVQSATLAAAEPKPASGGRNASGKARDERSGSVTFRRPGSLLPGRIPLPPEPASVAQPMQAPAIPPSATAVATVSPPAVSGPVLAAAAPGASAAGAPLMPATASQELPPIDTPATASAGTPAGGAALASSGSLAMGGAPVPPVPATSVGAGSVPPAAAGGPAVALASVTVPSSASVSVPPVVDTPPAPPVVPQPSRTLSVAEAFADFTVPAGDAAPAPGAVDVRRIRPTRAAQDAAARIDPAAGKPGSRASMPSHPSRIWVQIATGRDKAALAFDWRRMLRQSPEVLRNRKASISAWGQTNRLLTGPFDTEVAANAHIAQLRRASLGNPFVWTSPAGQVVDAIDGGSDEPGDARNDTRNERRGGATAAAASTATRATSSASRRQNRTEARTESRAATKAGTRRDASTETSPPARRKRR